MPAESSGGLGLYVHFPFCRSICPYCDFAVELAAEVPHERYARAVVAELERRAPEFAGLGPLRSVFFGGGTPSLWAPAAISTVLRAAGRLFELREAAEVSLEANPEDRAPDRLAQLRDLGVNRLSWGVQSFHDPALKALGRRHRGAEAREAIERSLRAGFASVSVDLIHGAAGQDAAAAAADARVAASLGIHHLSAYALTLEELAVDVPMARAQREGRLKLPDGDAQAEMGQALRAALAAGGLSRYEVSNYARGGARSVHNLGYWAGRPYLGVGVGASGATAQRRYANGRGAAKYLEALEAGGLPAGESEALSDDIRFRERVLLGLRLVDGLDLAELAAAFGAARVAQLRLRAAPLAGLATVTGERLALTERGLDLHSELALRLC